MPKNILMFVAGVMLLTAGSAMAAEDVPQTTVRFAVADLNDPAQAKQVLRQIRTAAKEVCAEGLSSPNGWVITDRQCERIALNEAVQKVGHPGLMAAATSDRTHWRDDSRRSAPQMTQK
ncbi:UrcA family protein [Asticcacaulis sp. DW145]|uniref:UrcA family protein n=1 Tax=Asticcacaulis sp. DW145 TaxID=3095608 RepID=UPI003092D7B2|nr:UrcA family protein [Asticcacaulis sp. DW145]